MGVLSTVAISLAIVALWYGSPTMQAIAETPAKVELPQQVHFNEHIRPILSDRCFACHGPDANHRQADLRLDDREVALALLAIVPGKPSESELLARVTSQDPESQMPPPASKKPLLTSKEIALLRRWIEQGAKYEQHWSYTPISSATPPEMEGANTANPIDRFILHKLRQNGIAALNPRADKERLLRRVTLDLTGVPPTIAEQDAFLADDDPKAYECVVDRLLASPRYGERMAVEWLDAARYADTHGYQVDRFRPMWPYRDWVVKAFNENRPFDQFAQWQIAGDLLPNATREQRLATAFNRLHSQNEEGGVVEEEFRVAYVADRVNTFGTVFLGLTFECTRCHDHKYDPLTQRDYYSLFAFFQNVSESGQTSYFTSAMPTPTLLLPTDEQERELSRLASEIKQQELKLAEVRATRQSSLDSWMNGRTGTLEPAKPAARFSFDSAEKNKLVNSFQADRPGKLNDAPPFVPGKFKQALQLNGENGASFAGVGDFNRASPFTLSIWIAPPAPRPRSVVLHHSSAPIDAGSRGYDLLLEENRVAFGLYHFWPGNALKVRSRLPIETNSWSHLAIVYDGSSKAAGVQIYLNGLRAELDVLSDNLWKDITYEGGEPALQLGHRFRDNGFQGGYADELAIYSTALSPLEVLHLADPHRAEKLWTTKFATPEQSSDGTAIEQLLREHYFTSVDAEYRQARQRLNELRDAQRKLVNPIPEAMVMEELPQPKPAFILNRGSYDQHGAPVTAATPAVLPSMPQQLPRNRLGLARWLTDKQNPLMSRVTVNRYWQMLFGTGLVETSDNFGAQGSTPSHPELLDWLASDFH